MDLLHDWLRLRPGVEVAISSSWREVHTLQELVGFFAEDLQDRVIGVTPQYTKDCWRQVDANRPAPSHVRHVEVLRWLALSRTPRAAGQGLDDQASLFRPGCAELMLVDGSAGLMPRDFARLNVALGFGGVRRTH